MLPRTLLLLTCFIFAVQSDAGEKKKLWAKSVIGEQAPELTVEKWLSAKPETDGKFLLIDFWATWCGPCRGAIPHLNGFHSKFKDDLVVIGISDESAERVKGLSSPKIEYFSAVDTKARMKSKLEVRGIPHVILVDPGGTVRWEGFPFLEGHELTEEILAGVISKFKDVPVKKTKAATALPRHGVAAPKLKASSTASSGPPPPPPPPPIPAE